MKGPRSTDIVAHDSVPKKCSLLKESKMLEEMAESRTWAGKVQDESGISYCDSKK